MNESVNIPRCENGLAGLAAEIEDRPLDPNEDANLIERVNNFTTRDNNKNTTLKCSVGACMLYCVFEKQVDTETGVTTYHRSTALGKRVCNEPIMGK